ncbi:MAG: argininosuccinate lyase [Pelomonas sp.]|nr:argininosuccinate lyase [Roseateles sp.]
MRIHTIVGAGALAVGVALGAPVRGLAESGAAPPHDQFYWLEQMNKASDVMLAEQKIVTPELARSIARCVEQTLEEGDRPGGARPDVSQYLALEARLVAIGGPEVTRLHSGRSRQDLQASVNRLTLRERLLAYVDAVVRVREDIAALARDHVDTIVPAYTNGVQAQPVTLAHYLLAFDAALARDQARAREAFARLDMSPLGAAALGGSSFPIDRQRLAALLGFGGVVDNTFDANLVASLDVPLEAVDVAESAALTIGGWIEDWELQYHGPHPWLLLREGKLTGPSSIMPQKRNPYGLIYVRQQASETVAAADAFRIAAHNLATGQLDYKHGLADAAIDQAVEMLGQLHKVLEAVAIDKARALAEVNEDYSTTTELADVLQREAGVPFRVGHQFASELVSYGRAHALRASQLPFDEARRIFREQARRLDFAPVELPLSEARFRELLTPENMVRSARVQGGPQRAEVERMLDATRAGIGADRAWLEGTRARLQRAQAQLDAAFGALAAPSK